MSNANINLANDPLFVPVYESDVHKVRFFLPAETGSYHTCRLLGARAQDTFSNAGSTREFLEAMADYVLGICNDGTKQQIRTDVGTMMQNLKYRLQYPVDDLCAIRVGAILSFMGDEDPNQLIDVITRRKIDMAVGNPHKGIEPDPALYAFFLSLGLSSSQSYRELSADIDVTEYLSRRTEMLNSLTPEVFCVQSPTK